LNLIISVFEFLLYFSGFLFHSFLRFFISFISQVFYFIHFSGFLFHSFLRFFISFLSLLVYFLSLCIQLFQRRINSEKTKNSDKKNKF
jgi:hypothetical protein